MNKWDYFEQEAKKNGLLAKRALKIKDFGSSWNTLTIHLLASKNNHLLTFVPNNVHEIKYCYE